MTKPVRKQLSAKTRFEVFKRDGFVCQYFCGICWNWIRGEAG